MIVHKAWLATRNNGRAEWEREGWYLFGFIPLYVRDRTFRGRYASRA